MICVITEPAKILNYLDLEREYIKFKRAELYKLSINPHVTVQDIISLQERLKNFVITCNNNAQIKFVEVDKISVKTRLTETTPSSFVVEEFVKLNSPSVKSIGTIFEGNVRITCTDRLYIEDNSFNPSKTLIINGRVLSQDEIKGISGNIFRNCNIKVTLKITTGEMKSLSDYFEGLNSIELRNVIVSVYEEAKEEQPSKLNDYYEELQNCVDRYTPKILDIDCVGVEAYEFI